MSYLEIEANKLENKVESKAKKKKKFNIDYIIPNLTEEVLLEEGYEYQGETFKDEYPYYIKDKFQIVFIGTRAILSSL